jgi:hypothetical protein
MYNTVISMPTILATCAQILQLEINSTSDIIPMAVTLFTQSLWYMLNRIFFYLENIHNFLQRKYLKTQTSSKYSMVIFSATDKDSADEFVLFFHQQSQHSGLLVDISSLDGYFLYRDKDNNCVVANSSDPPANKFLIIPVDE